MNPLPQSQAERLIAQIPGWSFSDGDNPGITREFAFSNFHQTMAFVNAMAWIAHQEDHHPDFEVGYRRCRITYRTHAIGGLSENDFICAAKINRLQESPD